MPASTAWAARLAEGGEEGTESIVRCGSPLATTTTSPMPPPPHRGGAGGGGGGRDTSAFFAATLVLWAVSVGFEIGARGRRELAPVAAGFAFFQAANAAVRAAVSRDPLFVNTAVSLLHSSLTAAAGLAAPSPPKPPTFGSVAFPIPVLRIHRIHEIVRSVPTLR